MFSLTFRLPLTLAIALTMGASNVPARASDLASTIKAVKPSVVGIGTRMRTRSPQIVFHATGFVTGDGRSVLTNAHGVPELDSERLEELGIVIARGDTVQFQPARLAGIDRLHDLAHLRLSGAALPALRLAPLASSIEEGQALAFTGFPLGMVLGLHPVTHRATLSAITPVVMPSLNSNKLNAHAIVQLNRAPFQVYQLDATAYPGNSGSPVYDPDSALVHGIMNMVYVKGLKETAITNPSGISYAIPTAFAHALLAQPDEYK